MDRVYNNLLENLKKKIKPCLTNGIAFTTDFWTDDSLQISYISLTGHLIDEEFNLQSYMLKTINFDEKKTGDNIRYMLFQTISNFFEFKENDLVNFKHKGLYSFVTDNGANIVAALKNEQRISCAGHNINLILEYLFKHLDENNEISILIQNCKSLVGYFKRSGLNNRLTVSLKQSVPTRWNSILTCYNL